MSTKTLADFDFETGEVLLLDKPLTWTSFDVVRKVKNTLRIKKIGHAGTLDPSGHRPAHFVHRQKNQGNRHHSGPGKGIHRHHPPG
jgi:hypothetical protein